MGKIKFGYQIDFRNPPGSPRAFTELYRETLSQAVTAERLGFDTVWLTEHHFTDDGYLPSIMPAAAAIAALTSTINIGSFVLLVPFYHPLKLAEEAAVVDVISGGRLRLGLGFGYRAEEFTGFGVERRERLGRTLETIRILQRAWTGERFSHEGRYFDLKEVRVLPTPASRPHPELLLGVGAPRAIKRAAEMGLSFACVGGRREIFAYIEALKQAGKDPADFSIVNSRIVYVADNEEQAWREVREAAMYQAELYGKWLAAAAGTTDMSRVLIRPDPDRLRRTSVLGSPEQVTTLVREILDKTPMTELITVMQLPGLDPAKARRSLERFGREVIPAFK